MAKTVVFDFDGVIHSYTSGWLGTTTIPDPPVPGIREALKEIHGAGYKVVVVSTRCVTAKGKGAIEAWLYNNGLREYIDKVCKEKPPAIAYIDDRAICFDGHPENLLKKIQSFEPWYKIPTITPPNEWISVEDRLPEDRQIVLFHQKDGFIYCAEHLAGVKDLPPAWLIDNDSWEGENITHWMALPAPPDSCPPEGEEDTK